MHFGLLDQEQPTTSATKQFEHEREDLADPVANVHDVPQRTMKLDLELERVAFIFPKPSHFDAAEKPRGLGKRQKSFRNFFPFVLAVDLRQQHGNVTALRIGQVTGQFVISFRFSTNRSAAKG